LNFFFTSEQLMLATSVRQCFERLPKYSDGSIAGPNGDVGTALAALAKKFGELGILGILASEEAGGLAMGFTDAILVAIEAGRNYVPFPVIETIVAAYYLARLRPEAACDLIEGNVIGTAAVSGSIRAVRKGGTVSLEGDILAPYARHARWITVPAIGADGEKLVALLELPLESTAINPAPIFDLTSPLDNISIQCEIDQTMVSPGSLESILALLASADMLGAAEGVNQRTNQYLNDRVQFGQRIGMNQALKHIAADNHVYLENMRVAVEYAAAAYDHFRAERLTGQTSDHKLIDAALSVAKSYSSRAARMIARDSTQLHGGMGFTWELGLHIPVRRMVRLSTSFGTTDDHHEHLAELIFAENFQT
jgi:alkylation response protein AidB-like acyl-CoA dehydrogenase